MKEMLMTYRPSIRSTGALAMLALSLACSSDNSLSPGGSNGTVVVKLTDAPFLADSLKSVDIFVVRVDGRLTSADSAAADTDLDNAGTGGWQALASPNASYNVLSLQNGVSTTLGSTTIAAGTYNGFRFIIDPSRSSVTLKNGTVLSGTSSPSVTFPSASRSGIKIALAQPVTIVGGASTTLLVDFDVNSSFVMRGNTIDKNGLLFKPVVKATITDAATTNATVRLANATGTSLSLLQGGTALSGGSNLAFGANSSCASVSAATPLLSVVQAGSTTALAGFSPTLQAGTSYTFVAYPTATGGGVQFVTLSNVYTPTSGQAGLRVFNATTGLAGFDVFVTASGAALGTPTVANVLATASSAFISVPAGTSQVRVATTGGTVALLDLGAQTFVAGQNATLVIAPPASGSTALRAFIVSGC
jgi:hypothetical protein